MQPITTMCRCGGMVDTRDLKSLACMGVPVRVRSAVPKVSLIEFIFTNIGNELSVLLHYIEVWGILSINIETMFLNHLGMDEIIQDEDDEGKKDGRFA